MKKEQIEPVKSNEYYMIEVDEFMDEEDLEFVKDFNEWKFTRVKDLEKEIEEDRKTATETLKRLRKVPIAIRMNPEDLEKVKEKAMQEGLPYQTLIGSILHKALQN